MQTLPWSNTETGPTINYSSSADGWLHTMGIRSKEMQIQNKNF